MLSGHLYNGYDEELVTMRRNARRIVRAFNATTEEETEQRKSLLRELFGSIGGDRIEIEPPFRCDYGCHIHLGNAVYMNFGCVVLDVARVDIGDNVLFGPNVHVYAASHPVDDVETRVSGLENGKPVKIGNNVWIGGGSIICPGVSIGDNTTIGAGSVVTKDIPANVVAAGNPCRVIRELKENKNVRDHMRESSV